MEFKWTTDLTSKTYQDALSLRKTVFIDEQKVKLEEEVDDFESDCYHVVGYLDGEAVATGRILPLENKGFRLQRVAVSKEGRGKGYGRDMINEMIAFAKGKEAQSVVLHAQDYAIPFYEKLGFTVTGEGFMDARIPHHTMVLKDSFL